MLCTQLVMFCQHAFSGSIYKQYKKRIVRENEKMTKQERKKQFFVTEKLEIAM